MLKLLESKDREVRRTALWALARCADLPEVPALLDALNDPDVDVVVEAHNALCWVSRRPNALDLPSDPYEGIPADAPEAVWKDAFEKWRRTAIAGWRAWYDRVRPYETRESVGPERPR